MKYIILIFIICSNFCFSQTQLEMNQEAEENYKKADLELNQVYNEILKNYKSDTKFILKLKAAQNAWIKFRDAEMDALFPEEETRYHYGSMYPMCWSMAKTHLTNERIKKLKVWLTGIEDGEMCSGSVKVKE